MARTSLPPGFRFHPTDVELVMYYLKRKVTGKKLHFEAIAEVNIYKFSPWDLPDKSCLKSKDREWFFFCPRERKYASGIRVKRATENGFWKTTGKDRHISYKDKHVGTVKTLVFHLGHAPKGERTDWVIHEYKMLDDQLAAAGVQDTYVLCKVFKKNGPGPKNGAQYGAPFDEAEWTAADDDGAQNQAISLASDGPSPTMLTLPENQSSPLVIGSDCPESMPGLPLADEGPSPSAGRSTSEVLLDETDDEVARLLASFIDDDTIASNENGINQGHFSGNGKDKCLPSSDGNDIYNGLGDLDSWAQLNGDGLGFSGMQMDDDSMNNMLLQDNSAYIELNDLLYPLNCPEGNFGAGQPSVGNVYGSYNHQNMQQFYPGSTSAGIPEPTSCTYQLPMLPEGSYNGYNCLDVLQMYNNGNEVNNQFFRGSSGAYDLNFSNRHQGNGVNFKQDLERGAHKKISHTRAALPPSAAAEQLALLLSSCCFGGSSIHIKAEVTHRECTKEALSVMMGGSGSCWCYFLKEMWLLWVRLLSLAEFGFCVVLVSCFFSETFSFSWSYYYCYLSECSLIVFLAYSRHKLLSLFAARVWVTFCDMHDNNVKKWLIRGERDCIFDFLLGFVVSFLIKVNESKYVGSRKIHNSLLPALFVIKLVFLFGSLLLLCEGKPVCFVEFPVVIKNT